jgi:hypothetical protein
VKKYIVLNIIVLMNVSNIFGTSWNAKDAQKAAQNFVYDCPYKKSTHAFILSYPLRFVNGKKGAGGGGGGASFYPTKPLGQLDRDTAIDLVVFPVIDNAVGRIMTPLKCLAHIRGATQHVSPHATEFILNNAQLVTSAAITRAIGIGAGKGFNSVGQEDVKLFGKCFLTQVSCDAVDEAMIKPLVKMTVGDDNSLIGWAVHVGLNMAFVNLFTSMVVKNKAV